MDSETAKDYWLVELKDRIGSGIIMDYGTGIDEKGMDEGQGLTVRHN